MSKPNEYYFDDETVKKWAIKEYLKCPTTGKTFQRGSPIHLKLVERANILGLDVEVCKNKLGSQIGWVYSYNKKLHQIICDKCSNNKTCCIKHVNKGRDDCEFCLEPCRYIYLCFHCIKHPFKAKF